MRMRYLLPLSLLLIAPACGDDPPPPVAPKSADAGGAGKGAGGKKDPKAAPQFAPRVRVEDRVLDPDEKKGIRHTFKERDFTVDQNNRDPFQSFVLNQGVIGPADTNRLPVDRTKKCSDQNMVATNYSYTDLRLVGIVAQGTQRKVLMMDSGNLGHIIKRGDCVGREKAVVKDIGTGYITFQVEPEETSTGVQKTAEERSIQLYPNQMPISSQPSLDNEAAKTATPDVAPPPTAPRQGTPENSGAPK
jgi:Tfp pilus assembly protein PilP